MYILVNIKWHVTHRGIHVSREKNGSYPMTICYTPGSRLRLRQSDIQGVSRLEDITAAGNFLGLSDQKNSYKHVSDFGLLRSYGHFLIPVHAPVWTASYGTSWWVMYSAWWLIFCVASIIFATWLAQFTTKRQPLLRPAVAFSKTSFKHWSIQINGNFTRLTLHLYFKCIMYYAGL